MEMRWCSCLVLDTLNSLQFILDINFLERADVLAMVELLLTTCQGGVGGRMEWNWQPLRSACGDCLL